MNRPDPKPEWYEVAIGEEKPCLSLRAYVWRVIIGWACSVYFLAGFGAAYWWLS